MTLKESFRFVEYFYTRVISQRRIIRPPRIYLFQLQLRIMPDLLNLEGGKLKLCRYWISAPHTKQRRRGCDSSLLFGHRALACSTYWAEYLGFSSITGKLQQHVCKRKKQLLQNSSWDFILSKIMGGCIHGNHLSISLSYCRIFGLTCSVCKVDLED